MSTATIMFLIIGGVGLGLLVLGLLGGELFHFDGFVPLEVVAAMLAAFGIGASVASSLLDTRSWGGLLAVIGIGVVSAGPAGGLAMRISRAASEMHTDATPVRDDLLGLTGVVVTPIPEQGYGEVRVALGGQPVKLNARADTAIPLGTQIFVISAPSETSVVVERVPISPLDDVPA